MCEVWLDAETDVAPKINFIQSSLVSRAGSKVKREGTPGIGTQGSPSPHT